MIFFSDSLKLTLGSLSSLSKIAARSRATPTWDSASGLFGVIAISIRTSFNFKASEITVPSFNSLLSTIIPEWSSPMPNSSSAQIIPLDSIPRILAFLISKFPLGMIAPNLANTTFCPASTFGAPQITCSSASPSFTLQTDSLSALGCFTFSTTFPTTKFLYRSFWSI